MTPMLRSWKHSTMYHVFHMWSIDIFVVECYAMRVLTTFSHCLHPPYKKCQAPQLFKRLRIGQIYWKWSFWAGIFCLAAFNCINSWVLIDENSRNLHISTSIVTFIPKPLRLVFIVDSSANYFLSREWLHPLLWQVATIRFPHQLSFSPRFRFFFRVVSDLSIAFSSLAPVYTLHCSSDWAGWLFTLKGKSIVEMMKERVDMCSWEFLNITEPFLSKGIQSVFIFQSAEWPLKIFILFSSFLRFFFCRFPERITLGSPLKPSHKGWCIVA